MSDVVDFRPELQKRGLGIVFSTLSKNEPNTIHYTFYLVTENVWRCTCKGFTYQEHCWHVKKAKQKLKESRATRDLETPEVDGFKGKGLL